MGRRVLALYTPAPGSISGTLYGVSSELYDMHTKYDLKTNNNNKNNNNIKKKGGPRD